MLDEVPHQYSLPEDGSIPAFDTDQGDNLGVMRVLPQNFIVRVGIRCIGQAGDREVVIGTVDMLGTMDGILPEVIDL
jgi:hypothetical protein